MSFLCFSLGYVLLTMGNVFMSFSGSWLRASIKAMHA